MDGRAPLRPTRARLRASCVPWALISLVGGVLDHDGAWPCGGIPNLGGYELDHLAPLLAVARGIDFVRAKMDRSGLIGKTARVSAFKGAHERLP